MKNFTPLASRTESKKDTVEALEALDFFSQGWKDSRNTHSV